MKVAQTPDELVSRKRMAEFIVTTLRIFLLTFVVAAVVSPPDPLAFMTLLVPAWVGGVALAYALVYRGDHERLAESGLYNPGALGQRRHALWFAGTVFALKLGLLVVGAELLDLRPGRPEDLALSVAFLAVGYLLVYQRGYDRLGVV